MPRPKPSDWSPVGLKGASVDDICSPEFFYDIINRHFMSADQACKNKILRSLKDILRTLRLGLHYRNRPTGGSKKVTLRKAERCLVAALNSLRSIDADSRRMIEKASEGDDAFEGRLDPYAWPIPGQSEPFEDRRGDEHYSAALERLEALSRWVTTAAAVTIPSRSGDTAEIAEANAVRSLLRLWIEIKGQKPTRKSFESFASKALDPVLSLRGPGQSLAGHVSKALSERARG